MFRFHVCCLAAVSVIYGCGADQYPKAVVTGKVMCGDKPAWGGVITFSPVDAPEQTGRPAGNPGGVSRATVQEDGSFRLEYEQRGASEPEDGAVIGPHRVTFILPMSETPKLTAEDLETSAEMQAQQRAYLESLPTYPKLACSSEITPSEVEVKEGDNAFDFSLEVGRPTSSKADKSRGLDE